MFGMRAGICSLSDKGLGLDLTTYVYVITIGPNIVRASSVLTNAVTCSFLLGSKNVRKGGGIIFKF